MAQPEVEFPHRLAECPAHRTGGEGVTSGIHPLSRPGFTSLEERPLGHRRPEVEGLDEETLQRPGRRVERDPAPDGKGEGLPPCGGVPQGDLDLPGPSLLEMSSHPEALQRPILSLRVGQESVQDPVQGPVERVSFADGGGKIQGGPEGAGTVPGPDWLDPLSPGQRPGLAPGAPEVPEECREGKVSQRPQGPDLEAVELFDGLPGEGKCLHRLVLQKGEELALVDEDGGARAGGDRGDPGGEGPRRSSHSHGSHKGTGKEVEEALQDPGHLVGRRTVEALHPIHPHLDHARLHRFEDRAHLSEAPQDLLHGGPVVGRVGLEKGEGRTEGDRLRDSHPRTDPGRRRPLGDLVDLSPARGPLSGTEKGDRSGVEFGRTHQFEPELEGGEPETESGARGRHAFDDKPKKNRNQPG